ncbi:protein asteroid homolog 1-like isoform X1 [Sphaeramia orbicularis]|uniref:protein asteroid homolog 1-like isoform X1 n=1 Tax=Sphaeramia orbicularis TaxID=375764 RepID=UPI00117CD68F|nr:protein asteroid homolog 1-like isoform X1 [Sphaeramia orbicularis]
MGVHKMTKLVRSHPRIYRDVQFRNSRLVVDGQNLLYLLYFSSGLDQNHGGDYAAFENLIERFISALRVCGVSPYVVVDGGSDPSDRKLETVTERAINRIQTAHRAAVSGQQLGILPQLAKLVFKQTLARLEVPLAQCYAEADHEIAALAAEWQCPVLSNDSDFYVFELQGGFLPISLFRWEEVKQTGSHQYIPCKRYNTSSFCIFFNIQPQLLPAFAALAGNDYVDLRKTDSTRKWAQVASDLEGLLHWLKGFQQPQDAFEAAVGMMGDMNQKKKGELLQGLFVGMEDYKIHPSSLKKFFIHGIAPPFIPGKEQVVPVPDWTWLPLTQARLNPNFLDVLVFGRISLSTPVEQQDIPSAHLVSRPIRQVAYALLLGSWSLQEVKECDRVGLNLSFTSIQPAFRGVTHQLNLSSLHKAEFSQRLQVLLETLGVPLDTLERLPSDLHLQVAATCYWLKKATPPPDLRLLKALLRWWSNEDSTRQRTAENQQCQHELDLDVTHSFNQWQACLKDSLELNQLLGWPLPEPRISRVYEGTVAHHLVHMMRSGNINIFLKHSCFSVKLYQSLLDVTCRFHTQEVEVPLNTELAATACSLHQGSNLLTRVHMLSLQYEDDQTETEERSSIRAETETILYDSVMVKTRHKTKDRISQYKKPQLVCKRERRAWM